MAHPLVNAYIEGRAKFKGFKGKYFDKEKNPKMACDIGAMYWGFYGKPSLDPYNLLARDFPEASNSHLVDIPCEHKEEGKGSILSILIHLNDEHDGRSGWTTDAKVKWLESALAT